MSASVNPVKIGDVFKVYNRLYTRSGLSHEYRFMIWDKIFEKLRGDPSDEKIKSVWQELESNITSEETMSRYGDPITIWKRPLVQLFTELVRELWPSHNLDYAVIKKEVDVASDRLWRQFLR